MKIISEVKYLFSDWCIIDDMFGSPQYENDMPTSVSSRWNYNFLFSSDNAQQFFHQLYNSHVSSIVNLSTLANEWDFSNVSVIDVTYIQRTTCDIMTWCKVLSKFFKNTLQSHNCLRLIVLWIHERYFPPPIKDQCIATLKNILPISWVLDCTLCHAPKYGDTINTCRFVIHISTVPHTINLDCDHSHSAGYNKHIYDNSGKKASIEKLSLREYDNISHCSFTARVIAVVHCSTDHALETVASSNYIIDTQFPAMEPSCHEYTNSILGRRFGIPFL
jgi:hypothetical protein